jgi:hypothetical protein
MSIIKCKKCKLNHDLIYRHDSHGWYTVCPNCGEVARLDLPDLEGHITMMFALQPDHDRHKYFFDTIAIGGVNEEGVGDLNEVPYSAVLVFDTPKRFMNEWYKMCHNYIGYHPLGMWYFVMDGTTNICAGAMDPGDQESFEDHFGDALENWRKPHEPSMKDECLRRIMHGVPEDKLQKILSVLIDDNRIGKDGICPVCGSEVEFNGDQEIVDDCTVVSYHCPHCGCSGKEESSIVFYSHFEVETEDGKQMIQ